MSLRTALPNSNYDSIDGYLGKNIHPGSDYFRHDWTLVNILMSSMLTLLGSGVGMTIFAIETWLTDGSELYCEINTSMILLLCYTDACSSTHLTVTI
jgi:hypothetical protein